MIKFNLMLVSPSSATPLCCRFSFSILHILGNHQLLYLFWQEIKCVQDVCLIATCVQSVTFSHVVLTVWEVADGTAVFATGGVVDLPCVPPRQHWCWYLLHRRGRPVISRRPLLTTQHNTRSFQNRLFRKPLRYKTTLGLHQHCWILEVVTIHPTLCNPLKCLLHSCKR